MPKAKKASKPKKKLPLLPRGYLSWSQLDLWERDPEKYKRKYFYGEEIPINDAMRFGKHIAELLDGKVKPTNHIEQSVKLLCQKYDSNEHHIRVKYKSEIGMIELDGYLDSLDTKTFNFIENKTGTTKWNYKKAENHGQMHFYYLLVILAHKTRPRQGVLQHLETEKNENGKFGRKLTGNIWPYEVELAIGHELEIRRRIENAVREISQAYQAALQIKA